MKRVLVFAYSVVAYLISFSAILFWIGYTGGFIPGVDINAQTESNLFLAALNNVFLVVLFGFQHSIMARKPFKRWLAQYIPEEAERSTFVLMSGIMLAFVVWRWMPLGGTLWSINPSSPWYLILYIGFALGWGLLFLSSFLINHFDLFGLRQGYLYLIGKPYTPLQFREKNLYKYIRHPLYLGGIIGLWATPHMSITHFLFAFGLSLYFILGAKLEEKDMEAEFGEEYRDYQRRTNMLLPKWRKNAGAKVVRNKG